MLLYSINQKCDLKFFFLTSFYLRKYGIVYIDL